MEPVTDRDRVTPVEAHRRAQPPRPDPAPSLRRVLTDPAIVDQVPTADVLNRPRFDRPQPRQASLPPPSQDPEAATNEALRRRAEAAEAKTAELERQARVAVETASPATFPPKVERRQSPAPISVPPATDQAIGRGIRLLLGRAWPLLLAAVGLGGGATAVLKPTAQPEKVDATAVRVTNAERAIDAQAKRTQAVEDYARELARVNRCLRRQQGRVNESAMPAPDHMGSARRPEPWVDDCPDDPKPP